MTRRPDLDLGGWSCTDHAILPLPAPEVRCKECHRPIWDPGSLARRTGPDCWDRIHGTALTRGHDVSPDQLTIPT